MAHRGTTMPDMLAAESPGERERIAEAIAQFLVAQSPHKFRRDAVGEQDVASGKELFHTVGCIACHSPRDESGHETTSEGVVELGHVAAKYSLQSLSDFLFQPLHVRSSGRMPDMKLTPVEAKAIAGYLLGKADSKTPSFELQNQLVADGKKYFQQFNCAACHKLGDIPAAAPQGNMSSLDTSRGCMANTLGKSPKFNLSDEQVKAIRSALAGQAGSGFRQDRGRDDPDGIQLHRLPCPRQLWRRFNRA